MTAAFQSHYNSLLFIQILFIFATLYENNFASVVAGKKTVLVLAPNFFASHFALHRKLVEILVAKEWVKHVHMLIIEDTSLLNRNKKFKSGPKLTLQYFNARELGLHKLREWEPRREPRSKYLRRPGYHDLEKNHFFEFARHKEQVMALRKKNFDIGIAEAWEFAAFPLLRLIGVRHMVATLNMPLLSIYYEIMDSQYLQSIIHQGNVPEVWTTMCGDHLKNDAADIFRLMHITNVHITSQAYRAMDEKFATLYKDYKRKDLFTSFSGMFNKELGEMDDVEAIPTYRTIRHLLHECAHFFVNTQPFLEFTMPPGMPQKVAFIGGITFAEHSADSSSSDSDSNLDVIEQLAKNRDGLTLVSFGSMAKFEEIPPDKMSALLWTFCEYHSNYLFIVKCTGDIHVGCGNVIFRPWVPQIELLANPHIKLFISHCGINSVLEAAHHGVPLLCVPLFADQFYNAEAMAKRGAAVVLDKDLMQHREEVRAKLQEALHDSYKNAMRKIQNHMAETRPVKEFLERIYGLS